MSELAKENNWEEKYPQITNNIKLSLTGCTTNLQIYPQGSSGSRVFMQGAHYVQTPQISAPEKRHIFAGPERDYANYMFNVTVEEDCRVIRVVERKHLPGCRKSFERLLIVEYLKRKVKTIGQIVIENVIQNDTTFGTQLELTDLGKNVGAGDFLQKGDILAQTTSVVEGEYALGVHANTMLAPHPLVIEDSCLISQSLADSLFTWGYKTYRMTVGRKRYPLYVYEKDGVKSIIPNVGDRVRDDGLLMAARDYDEFLAAVEMAEDLISEPCGHTDHCVYTKSEAEVIDIRVYRNHLRERLFDEKRGEWMSNPNFFTPDAMQLELDKYANALSNYQKQLRTEYRKIKDTFKGKRNKGCHIEPDLTQTFMYAIADDPRDVMRGEYKDPPRYIKQFDKTKCDEYLIEVKVRYPIPLTVSGKITDTMGGKGIVGDIRPDEDMPIDENGNRVHLIMSENAMLRRTNWNRGFENYINAARRDIQEDIIKLVNEDKYDKAWLLLSEFTYAINPEWEDAIAVAHSDDDDKIDLLDALHAREEDLRLWVPSDNKYAMGQVINNVVNNFAPKKSKVQLTMENGEKRWSKFDVMVGQLYIIRLDKWGGDWSAISACRYQATGTISKPHSSDKDKRPGNEVPITFVGESEARHQNAYIGGDIVADLHDRSNNPTVSDHETETLLTAEVVSNVEEAVDRKRFPIGRNRVMSTHHSILLSDGIVHRAKKM